MRQGNGTELLGMNDPRSATIGVIYVSPNDDRKSVLAAILTQEKLGRNDIVIDLPESNKAFQHSQDFDDLKKSVVRNLQARIIFVASGDAANYANQRQFLVFPSLDDYTKSLDKNDAGNKKEAEHRGLKLPFFGGRSKPLNRGAAVAGGAVAGAAAASALSRAEQDTPRATGRQANTGNPPPDLDESDDQSVAHISPRRGSTVPSTPVSTPASSTIDDDDALDDAPSVSVRHGSGTAGAAAAGAAGGFLVGETLRRGQANPNLDAAGPTPLKSASPDTPGVSSVSQQTPPATPITNASEPAEEAGGDPGIIDLRPVPRGGVRSTVDLRGTPAAAGAAQIAQPVEPPAPRGAGRRRNGGGAAAAAGGLALGAAVAGTTPAGAPTAASGGANATGIAPVPARPAGSGQPPLRGAPPPVRGRRGNTPPRRSRALLLLLLLLLLTALISGFVYSSINPAGFQTTVVRPFSNLLPVQSNPATISVVPDSKEVQDSYVLQAVTTQPNADQLQVGMRNLNVAPDAQNKTVAGTGHGQIAAVAAKGRLTFLNGSFSPFTVGSGTVISASNGVSVVTDQPAVIPAGVPGGANGSTSVSAHAVTGGTGGDLDQGAINKGCCSNQNFVFVKNDAPFTGGVDAQSYTYVRQGDVDTAAAPLESTLSQQASTQFKQQLKSNEQLVGNPTCNSNVQVPPGTVGNQGHAIASATITVTAKCTGVAYDRGAAQAIAKDRLQKKANIDPGQGYSLVGNIATDVSISKVNADSISLLANARGIWVYQFDTAKQQAMAKQLAGKKVSDARTFINAQNGINNAKIDAKGDTLPTDPTQITFKVQSVSGENVSSGNEDNGNNNNPNGTPAPVSGKGLVPGDSGKDKRA